MEETLFSINGKIVPEKEARVPVTDRGFLYGDGLFETLHAYGRTVFLMKAHLERLARGIKSLEIQGAPSPRQLGRWIEEGVRAARYPETNVRLHLTRGTGPRGPSITGPFRPFTAITLTNYHRRPERDYRDGVKAVMASFRRQESSVIAGLKTSAYIEQILARREADRAGADEALLLNSSGLLCEGSASNITLVRDGHLLVPDPVRCGALPGTIQKAVCDLAIGIGLTVCWVPLGPFDLRDAQEAFLTGSLREITPLVEVQGKPVGPGKPGPLTRRLIHAYRARVERVCPGFRFKQRLDVLTRCG